MKMMRINILILNILMKNLSREIKLLFSMMIIFFLDRVQQDLLGVKIRINN